MQEKPNVWLIFLTRSAISGIFLPPPTRVMHRLGIWFANRGAISQRSSAPRAQSASKRLANRMRSVSDASFSRSGEKRSRSMPLGITLMRCIGIPYTSCKYARRSSLTAMLCSPQRERNRRRSPERNFACTVTISAHPKRRTPCIKRAGIRACACATSIFSRLINARILRRKSSHCKGECVPRGMWICGMPIFFKRSAVIPPEDATNTSSPRSKSTCASCAIWVSAPPSAKWSVKIRIFIGITPFFVSFSIAGSFMHKSYRLRMC